MGTMMTKVGLLVLFCPCLVRATPTITSIAPVSANVGSSVPVTLTGSGFGAVATVTADAGVRVTKVAVVSATQITATLAIAATARTGPAKVTVKTATGSSASVIFTVQPESPRTATPMSTVAGMPLAASAASGVTPTREYIRLGARVIAIETPGSVNLIGTPSFTNQNATAITMPAPAGTTAINVGWSTSVNANCTYGGLVSNGDGTTSHYVTRSPLTNGFNETKTIVCTDVSNPANSASIQVSISVQNSPITISGLYFTNQSGTVISMPAPVGTTAINVAWATSVNANCTYGGVAANGDGTTAFYVTRSPVTSGFSETQTIICTDLSNSSNTTSTTVSISVQGIVISGLNYTDQNGIAITSMPAPFGTTAINVGWSTNVTSNCTYGGVAANGNGTTSFYVTRSPLSNGFSETQTIACTDVANSANVASTSVSISVQAAITISGIYYTNQSGTVISMPAPVGTTAINVGWSTNINGNCTYGGFAANGNGTTSHYATRSPLTNGFSETQTIACTDVGNSADTASTTVSIAVQNPALTIIGLNYTDQNGTTIASMPAPAGTTAINVGWSTNINANCTYGGVAANGNGSTSHYVTRSPLSNGFSETQSISCTDVSNASNTASTTVSISVQAAITISGVYYTNQNGTVISMPAPAGTTAINVGWYTNINANCTYAGFAANGNGTTSHYVTRSPLSNGFSETQTITCTDVASPGNTASTSVSISVQNPPMTITGLYFTNQNGTVIGMPAPAGTTAINVGWSTDINADCTNGGFAANGNGTTSHYVTRSPLSNGFSETQTITCTDVSNSANSASTTVTISIQNPPITITGLYYTDQNGTTITSMPAPFGTTAINVGWSTNINANCTYGGFAANNNGMTTHSVTRSPLSNGFSETQTITCTDVTNAANATSTTVSISVQAAIAISGVYFTDQNGTVINMPAPSGTTAINVGWYTNINANCTYGGFTANGDGSTIHYVTRAPVSSGFSETQTITCTDVVSAANATSTSVSVSVQ